MFTTRPELRGTFGMVATTHWIATGVAMGVLERGGNAFDAAVAAGFTLQVVEPHLNGPGGECPILLHDAGRRQTLVLCGQGVAPAAASIERFRNLGLTHVPGTGLLPAVVPGAFDAWMLLLRDHGTWRLADVLEPAIRYADGGVPVVPPMMRTIASTADLFRREWTSSAALWLPHGAPPDGRSLLSNPALAETYRRLLAETASASWNREGQIEAARRVWYTGFVAEAIDRYCRSAEAMDNTGRRHPALLTGDDLVAWHATYEAPATLDYGDFVVCKTGPWGQGPVFLQQLALLRHFDIAGMDPAGAEFVHTVTECAKLAFADREAYYGDPPGREVPLTTLLSENYNAARARLVNSYASQNLRPGAVGGGSPPKLPSPPDPTSTPAQVGTGEPTVARVDKRVGDTVHLDVVDRHGNMVSATPSGGWLQSSPAIPGLGFCLSTRGQMFWLDPGHPSALHPRRRPRTTLSPTIALRDEHPVLAFGTPGGDQQDQWSLTYFLRLAHHGMDLQAAIDAPAFHTAHFPSSFDPRVAEPGRIYLEGRFDPEVIAELERRGHDVVTTEDWSLGRLSAVARRQADDGATILEAAANPRGMQGYAAGR